MPYTSDRGRLLVTCHDRPGIVAAISDFLFRHGANIIHSDQHTAESGRFFMRIEFDLPDLPNHLNALQTEFADGIGRALDIHSR